MLLASLGQIATDRHPMMRDTARRRKPSRRVVHGPQRTPILVTIL
jgi:hypothetical protein